MRKCKSIKRLRRVSSFLVLMCCVFMVLPSFSSAAVLEPYNYKTEVVAGKDGYLVTVDLPKDQIWWKWVCAGYIPFTYTSTGQSSHVILPERDMDNLLVYVHNFGHDSKTDLSNMMATENLTNDAKLNLWIQMTIASDCSQFFDLNAHVRIAYCNSAGTILKDEIVYSESSTFEPDGGDGSMVFLIADNSYTIDSSAGDYFYLYTFIEFRALPDETITDGIYCTLNDSMNQIVMPLTSLYYEQMESNQPNAILGRVEDQLKENGQKLDDLITGGDAGDDLISGSDKLEDAGEGLGDDIGQIGDFEDQYFGQLEDNLDEVIAGADLSLLVSPLLFIQVYLNKIVAGTPSKYLVVFTLPVLFGIFMYIVGHPIRAPQPDTSGDVVTRETFTTTTVLDGPRAGSTTSSRTVTTSQEIGRIHSG